jgi:hypothetical protein
MKRLNQNRVDLRGEVSTRWRAAFKALALPAARVHNYRNLHRSMFYDAMSDLDCKDTK